MKQMIRLLLISLLIGILACTQEAPKNKSLDMADLDTLVSPAADFDAYANGGWKKRFPMPDEKSRFGTFDLLANTAEAPGKMFIPWVVSA